MTSANSMSIFKVCAIWRDARWIHALRNWGTYAAGAIVRLKALAPYALIELILPGGSVMALLLWLYRRRRNGVGFGRLRRIVVGSFAWQILYSMRVPIRRESVIESGKCPS
jgi:hypothetical protein